MDLFEGREVESGSMEVSVPESTVKEVKDLVVWSKSVIVKTEEEKTAVFDQLKEIKDQLKALDEIFDPNISRWHEGHKNAIAEKTKWTDPLEAAKRAGLKAIDIFDAEERKRRDEERRRLQAEEDERARREREKLLKRAEQLKTPEKAEALREAAEEVEAAVVQIAEPEKLDGQVKRTTWNFEIVDESKIPREYLIPDLKAIGGVVRNTKGKIKIDGIRIYSETKTVIRG